MQPQRGAAFVHNGYCGSSFTPGTGTAVGSAMPASLLRPAGGEAMTVHPMGAPPFQFAASNHPHHQHHQHVIPPVAGTTAASAATGFTHSQLATLQPVHVVPVQSSLAVSQQPTSTSMDATAAACCSGINSVSVPANITATAATAAVGDGRAAALGGGGACLLSGGTDDAAARTVMADGTVLPPAIQASWKVLELARMQMMQRPEHLPHFLVAHSHHQHEPGGLCCGQRVIHHGIIPTIQTIDVPVCHHANTYPAMHIPMQPTCHHVGAGNTLSGIAAAGAPLNVWRDCVVQHGEPAAVPPVNVAAATTTPALDNADAVDRHDSSDFSDDSDKDDDASNDSSDDANNGGDTDEVAVAPSLSASQSTVTAALTRSSSGVATTAPGSNTLAVNCGEGLQALDTMPHASTSTSTTAAATTSAGNTGCCGNSPAASAGAGEAGDHDASGHASSSPNLANNDGDDDDDDDESDMEIDVEGSVSADESDAGGRNECECSADDEERSLSSEQLQAVKESMSQVWFTRKPDKDQLQEKGVTWKHGAWSAAEVKMLQDNICKYLLDNNKATLQEVVMVPKKEMRKDFYRIIAKGIDRPLFSVYRRVRRMCEELKNGKYSPAEVEKLKELHSKYKTDWVNIGKLMGRSASSVKDRFRLVKENGKNGKWTEEEENMLLHAVHDVTATPIGETVDKAVIWSKVAEKVPSRSEKQCRIKWINFLSWKEQKGAEWTAQDELDLIGKIQALDVSDESGIDWTSLAKGWASVRSPQWLHSRWWSMKRIVPKPVLASHKETIEYMSKMYPGVLERKAKKKLPSGKRAQKAKTAPRTRSSESSPGRIHESPATRSDDVPSYGSDTTPGVQQLPEPTTNNGS
ncbi:uncharacterized protein LOC135809526 [Sycon ciliatum]|uniref:uncharacterized protein LOC135809526 n=1 Tax=Sycon ciliatum TaxID=27933 RepID=UPI0031F6BDB3|eukprot:scpid69913/ scgid20080/ Cyclin-D-binding Myb-like transcription factor 1